MEPLQVRRNNLLPCAPQHARHDLATRMARGKMPSEGIPSENRPQQEPLGPPPALREGGLPRRHPTRHGQEGLRRGRRLKGQGRRPVPVNFPRLGIPSLRKGYTAGCMASSTGKHAKARLPQVSDTRSIYPKYRMRVLGSPPFPGFQESVEVPAPLLWPCLAI